MAFHRRKVLGAGAIALALAATGTQSFAQAFPNKPITLVVPFAPGGNTDMVARSAGVALQKVLGQSVIIDNRAGGGGARVATGDPVRMCIPISSAPITVSALVSTTTPTRVFGLKAISV